ncbi:deaminated glutathione amidase [Trichomonascus vanleenenianus]|uniref:putative hydrolase n=1 Tax=Trichomonascus vanleenenianus TaxID=2268995 RepID=UPI003EC9FA73
MAARSVLIAVGQLCSTPDVARNTQLAVSLIRKAGSHGAKALFLPEASDYIGGGRANCKPVEESLFVKGVQEAAQQAQVQVCVGIHEPGIDPDKVKNTLLWIDDRGKIAHRYQKIHLFDVDIKNGGQSLKESDTVEPGNEIPQPWETPVGKVGPAICYDIRFPEQALKLRQLGAEVLVFPSAFTTRTGAAHWNILGRARAIDTQCYVVMAAQVGTHTEKRASYGHAMIIDPWGSVVAEAADVDSEPRLALAEIDLDAVERIRANMPLWEQRRPDCY